jgi:hypothetical protein
MFDPERNQEPNHKSGKILVSEVPHIFAGMWYQIQTSVKQHENNI